MSAPALPREDQTTEQTTGDAAKCCLCEAVAIAGLWHGCEAIFPLCDEHVQRNVDGLLEDEREDRETECSACEAVVDRRTWIIRPI